MEYPTTAAAAIVERRVDFQVGSDLADDDDIGVRGRDDGNTIPEEEEEIKEGLQYNAQILLNSLDSHWQIVRSAWSVIGGNVCSSSHPFCAG